MEQSDNVLEIKMCKCGRAPYRKSGRNCHLCNAAAQREYRRSLKTPVGFVRAWRPESDRKRAIAAPAEPRNGFVYFIQAEGGGDIKIGFSATPTKRLAELQTGASKRLVFLGVMTGSPDVERELHKKFKAHRLMGEWFLPAAEILAFVETFCVSIDSVAA